MENVGNILSWVVFGGIAGWIASIFFGGKKGCITNIILGVIGSVVGGALFQHFGQQGITGFNLPSLGIAIVGAAVVLVIAGLFKK